MCIRDDLEFGFGSRTRRTRTHAHECNMSHEPTPQFYWGIFWMFLDHSYYAIVHLRDDSKLERCVLQRFSLENDFPWPLGLDPTGARKHQSTQRTIRSHARADLPSFRSIGFPECPRLLVFVVYYFPESSWLRG